MNYIIRLECCNCKKYLGEKLGGNKPNMVSHGYCKECLKKAEKEINEFFEERGCDYVD